MRFVLRRSGRLGRALLGLTALLLPLDALSQVPTVTRVVPAFGTAAGNNVVVVGGTAFQAGATVTFGGIPASSVTVNNATALTAKPPSHAAGSVAVAVTNPGGATGSLAGAYKYVAPTGQLAFQYFPIPFAAFSTDITAGPGGALWFLTNAGEDLGPDGIGRITTAGSFTEYPLTASGLLRDIAPGLDGNLWYTRVRAPFTTDPDKVGRMTPLGVATEFTLPVNGNPSAITAGPDGATWFTEPDLQRIARITSSGTITEYFVGARGRGLTLGPDGQLWIAGCEGCAGFRPGTPFVPFPPPNPVPGTCPDKIVAGPDGNLWFQYSGSRKTIGRVSTSGAYMEFPVPSGLAIHDIAAGIDGNLWFTSSDFVDAWVGRITPWGQITEFPLPPGSVPRGITAGPDGALWFANGYDIGRVNPGAPPPTSPGSFFTVPPCRVLDTRNANGPFGGPALSAGLTRSFGVSGQCGIPATARAVSVNMTVTQGAVAGHLTAFPGGTPQPLVSSVNFRGSQTRANNAVLQLGSAGNVAVISGQASGTVHFILDVNGYFE